MANTNIIMESANTILAALLQGDASARPNIIYVEYQIPNENESIAQPVTDLPVITPADKDYYLKLRANKGSNRDFLRCPIASITQQAGTNPDDIVLLFQAIVNGDIGVGGKSTKGAIIYGMALANSPTYGVNIDDLTRDVVWAVGRFAPENQMVFSQVTQTAVTYRLNLTN